VRQRCETHDGIAVPLFGPCCSLEEERGLHAEQRERRRRKG
jgi:hypothetical protein